MALITRISRLFHADMNAVLDQIEEPELLLKQAIREMEETLSSNEQQLKLLDLEQQNLSRKENEYKKSLADLDEQLIVCFESNKDDLSRSLIKRKLETVQYLNALSTQHSNATENITQLKVLIKEQASQLNNMKQKEDIFKKTTVTTDPSWNNLASSIKDEDIEIALLHEKQKWSQS